MIQIRLRQLKLLDQCFSYLKLGQELLSLYKYQKDFKKWSIVSCLPLFNFRYFHLHSAGAFNLISCFILTWDTVGNQNSPSGRNKGKPFPQMISLLSRLSQHFFLLLFFVVKEKSPKNSFDLLPVRGWQCSNLITFNPKFRWCELNSVPVLQLRPFLG